MCLFHGWLMTAYLRGEPGSAKQAALLRVALGMPPQRPGGGSGGGGGGGGGGERTRADLEAIYSGDLTPSAALTSLSYGLMTRLPSLEVPPDPPRSPEIPRDDPR